MCYSVLINKNDFQEGIFGSPNFEQWVELEHTCTQDPKFFKMPDAHGRIFPNVFAPVLIHEKKSNYIVPMRYQIWPKNFAHDPQHLSLFNARFDALTKANGLWHHIFGKQHGIVVIEKFYEWVAVRDLLKAGVVSLNDVKAEFAKHELKRKKEALAKGKPYKPTKTALMVPTERKIEITFVPLHKKKIIAPVIFDEHTLPNHFILKSFALLTDDPPAEVAAAGHDRSPIFLKPEAALEWLHPERYGTQELLEILKNREDIHYVHDLARAA